MKFLRYLFLISLFSIQSGCTINAFPVPAKVGVYDIAGKITDRINGQPIENVLVVATIEEGGFWGRPSSYDLGHAYTNSEGEFLIKASNQQVYNLHNAYVNVEVQTHKRGYMYELYSIPRDKKSDFKSIALRQSDKEFQMYDAQCLYRTPTTCELIKSAIAARQTR